MQNIYYEYEITFYFQYWLYSITVSHTLLNETVDIGESHGDAINVQF